MLKRISFVVLAVVLVVGLFISGCAKPAPAPAPKATPAPTPAPAPAPAPAAAPAPVIEVIAAGADPENHPVWTEGVVLGLKWIEEQAKGRVKFTYYTSGTLLKTPDLYSGVAKGVAHVVSFMPGWYAGQFPLSEIMDLPPGITDSQQSTVIHWEYYKKYLATQPEWASVKMLWVVGAPQDVSTVNKPLNVPADIKGLRIRSHGLQGSIMEALGAVPVNIAAPDTYQALQKGLVDGICSHVLGLKANKWAEVCRNYQAMAINCPVSVTVMNLEKYNALPADIKKLFDQVSEWLPPAFGKARGATERDSVDFVKQQGGKVITYTPEQRAAWLKAAMVVNDKWAEGLEAKGQPGKKLLSERYAFLKQYLPEVFK